MNSLASIHPTKEWLSLSDTAALLGVHPGTVRSWSDQGVLPVHRTQGGHRRYLRSEMETWLQTRHSQAEFTLQVTDAGQIVQNALRNTRIQISEGRLLNQSWYGKLDEDARMQYRYSGRSLLEGLLNYIAAGTDDKLGTSEADALGYEYAARGRRYGLYPSEAVQAFLFFRNLLLDAMWTAFESSTVHAPDAWGMLFRKVTAFTDRILITLLETYETYQRAHL